MKKGLKIGTCGFSRSKAEYIQLLSCVEVQQTFYQPPQITTLERWRKEAPANFEFALKAWQLITHEAKSPTYRRLTRNLTEEEKRDAGYFKPTPIVQEAWTVTLACAKALQAETVLFQCPASFKPTRENVEHMERFFTTIEREGLNLGWEPRGDWNAKLVKDLCRDLKLWHVVDPFETTTQTPNRCYYRLHGRTGWRYKYEEHELTELALLLPKNKHAYVFFNNVYMTEDAVRFKKIVSSNSP